MPENEAIKILKDKNKSSEQMIAYYEGQNGDNRDMIYHHKRVLKYNQKRLAILEREN